MLWTKFSRRQNAFAVNPLSRNFWTRAILAARGRDCFLRRGMEILLVNFPPTYDLVHKEGRCTSANGYAELELTPKEFEILRYLIAHRGQTITRSDLLDQVWGMNDYPTTRTVDNHILKLRKKIEKDPANPDFIITIHGLGYKFLG